MAGQIIKRGDRVWIVRIFMGRDAATGKRRYLNKTIHGTKKEADKYLNSTLTAISTGTFVEPSPLTVNAYLDKWLEAAARPRLTERTFISYEWLLNHYVRPALGDKKLADVRPLHIQALYGHMLATKLKDEEAPKPSVTYGLGLSPRSVRYTHSVLSSAFKQAVRWHMLARNPCESVELPRMAQREMQAFSPEEAARFLAAAAEDAYATLFTFALATGMRPEEYLALKWSDVDLQKGTATVVRTLIWRAGGGWYFGEPKTARSRRTVPFSASVLRALISHKRRQAEERMKAGADYQVHDFVFASREGSPLMPRNILRRHFKPTLLRAKLSENFRLYDLRHTCATLLLAANEHPKVVSERLGHASITLTLDTYSHVLPSMQQAASEKLESILFKKNGTQ